MKFKEFWAGIMPSMADKIVKDAAGDAAIVLDKDGIIVALNEQFIEIYDIPEDLNLIGENFEKLMDAFNESSVFYEAYRSTLESREKTVTIGFSNKYKNWLVARTHLYENKYIVLLLNTINDNSKSNIFSNQYDYLTLLPNRAYFENDKKRLDVVDPLYVLVDLKRFHVVNETLGSFVGDEILKELARRLRMSLTKRSFAYRISGDQFMLLLPNSDKDVVFNKIQEKLGEIFQIKNHNIMINYFLGLYKPKEDEDHFKKALYYTELALIKGKFNNQKIMEYEPAMRNHAETLRLERDLLEAIEKKPEQFSMKYQLQQSLETHTVCGSEALIRWNHPERGLVDVEMFLKLSQDLGVMASIDKIVFNQVLNDIRSFKKQGVDFIVSINLSSQGLMNADFQQHMLSVLKNEKLPIGFEITETEWIDASKCADFLSEVNALGYKISIDDFGVGYSSFEYLLNYPTDYIKIDKKFIKEITSNKAHQTIVANIIKMGKGLNVKLVAEGVETQDERDWLLKNGCNVIQGYFYYKPETPVNVVKILKKLKDEQ